ncbi:MAG TPA: FecR domain-containing protein [Caulobacteraceae bacterium]|nr:FecR domain-containing protein [Caulobacteraceae bacterium]
MSAPDLAPVKQAAVAWFTRQRGGLTPEETRELDAWLEADPAHLEAFEAVARAWARLELPREAPEMLALRARALEVVPERRRVWRMAAGIAAAVALGGGLYGWDTLRFREYPDQTFRTEVGQRSTVTLPDGSVVTLNTDTVLRTRSDGERRLLYLDRGQAYFKVARDPRHPFEVHAAGRTVTALGTAFDVRVEPGKFAVTLVEGKVRVETPSPKPAIAAASAVQDVELVAGNQFTALDETRWSVGRADTERETAWRTGWLTFQNQPLGEVVAEFARYSEREIVLDPALAQRPITGRFKAGDVDAFVEALAAYDVARLETDREVVRLTRPPASM